MSELIERECAVWDALVAGDAAADQALLAEDFLGVYPTGFAARSEHAAQLAGGPSIAQYVMLTPRLLPIDDDTAMLSYKARFVRTSQSIAEEMYVSSLWQRRHGEWINVFSQDTPAQPSASSSS